MMDTANLSSDVQSAGPVQQPDAAQVAALSPESREAIATELGHRYPNQKAQINEWYQQQQPAPATPAEQMREMFKPGDASGADIDLSLARHTMITNGHPAAEVASYLHDLGTNLAALELPSSILSSIGDGMVRGTMAYQADPEAANVEWQTAIRPLVERVARNADGSKASWKQVQQGVQTAVGKLAPAFRDEVINGGALNYANVVLQLFLAGQRILAQQGMAKA